MKKIFHIITGLKTGGAEMMLYKIVSVSKYDHVVVCLNGDDSSPIAKKIISLGIKVYFLNMKASAFKIKSMYQLWGAFKQERPNIIQGWMYHGNIIASLIAVFFPKTPVLWNVRHSLHDIKKESFSMRQVIRINRLLSKRPNLVIYNSSTAARQHEAFGFSDDKSKIIPNGFDENLFMPEESKRQAIRKDYDIDKNEYLLGLVARFHPMKGHQVFLHAINHLMSHSIKLKVMLIGNGLDASNKSLVELIDQLGLSENIILLGEREDVAELVASFDLAISASLWGEGFSNTIGEAMLSGVPCVVTDVGDSKWIVGEFGKVVAANDAEQLAQACLEILNMEQSQRQQLGKKARVRIQQNFGLKAITAEYDHLYQTIKS